jgi:hypothetical protein
MKNAILLPLGLTVLITISMGFRSDKMLISSGNVVAITRPLASLEKVDGDQLIETLILQRFNFNKALIKDGFDPQKQFPKAISIINSSVAGIVSFNGFDYFVKQNRVIGVNGIGLSPSALATITEQMFKLDQMQQYCCVQANLEYKRETRNLNEIKALDRQYFAALRAFKLVTSNIADLASKSSASLDIEIAVAKIKLPDIKIIGMKTENKGSYVAEIK